MPKMYQSFQGIKAKFIAEERSWKNSKKYDHRAKQHKCRSNEIQIVTWRKNSKAGWIYEGNIVIKEIAKKR